MQLPSRDSTARSWRLTATALLLVLVVPEALFQLADAGLVGSPRWRHAAYSNGALWQGLLDNWHPNFAAQPLTMFFTHAMLHRGAGHLAGNVLCLAILAPALGRRHGGGGLWLIFLASVLAGALGFVLLADTPRPMIGASGGVYGFAAAWIHGDWHTPSARPYARLAVLLVINAVSWWWVDGDLAWQAHLGGTFGGWLAAAGLARHRARRGPLRASLRGREPPA